MTAAVFGVASWRCFGRGAVTHALSTGNGRVGFCTTRRTKEATGWSSISSAARRKFIVASALDRSASSGGSPSASERSHPARSFLRAQV